MGADLDRARWRDATAFGILASLAILAKGNGLLLMLVPPLALILAGRIAYLASPSFYWPALIILGLCGPWYYYSLDMMKNGCMESSPRLDFTIRALSCYMNFPGLLGVTLTGFLGLGVFVHILWPRLAGRVEGRWAVLGALLVATVSFHCIVPVSLETRYLMVAVAPALTLVAGGIDWVTRLLPARLAWIRPGGALLVLVLASALGEKIRIARRPCRGFQEVARELLAMPGPSQSVFLVSSDATGEGMFISEVALRDVRPGHVVLRASKVLATSGWSGNNYTLLHRNSDEILTYLTEVPVSAVVIDTIIDPSEGRLRQHLPLLQTLELHPERWRLVGSYTKTIGQAVNNGAIRVYLSRDPPRRPTGPVRLRMSEMLGRDIVLDGNERNDPIPLDIPPGRPG